MLEGRKKENEILEGWNAEVQGNGKTDLKRGVLKGEVKYTFKG